MVLGVIGDRSTFPESLAEGDAVQYAPGDPKKKLSISKDKGVSLEADDKNMSLSTKEHMSMGAKTADLFGGAISVDEAGNVTFKGNLTVSRQPRRSARTSRSPAAPRSVVTSS